MSVRPNHHQHPGTAGSTYWPFFNSKNGGRYTSDDGRFSFEPVGKGRYDVFERTADQPARRIATRIKGVPACRRKVHEFLHREARGVEEHLTGNGHDANAGASLQPSPKATAPPHRDQPPLPRMPAALWNLRKILMRCMELADPDGIFRVGQTALGKDTGLALSSVQRYVAWLLAAGYLVKIEEPRSGARTDGGTVYGFDERNRPVNPLLARLPTADPSGSNGNERVTKIVHIVKDLPSNPVEDVPVTQATSTAPDDRLMVGRAMVLMREHAERMDALAAENAALRERVETLEGALELTVGNSANVPLLATQIREIRGWLETTFRTKID